MAESARSFVPTHKLINERRKRKENSGNRSRKDKTVERHLLVQIRGV